MMCVHGVLEVAIISFQSLFSESARETPVTARKGATKRRISKVAGPLRSSEESVASAKICSAKKQQKLWQQMC